MDEQLVNHIITNNEETQSIDKDAIKNFVQEYLNIDKEILQLKNAIKERNTKKGIISNKILLFMKDYNIDDMNFSYGRLSYKTTQKKTALKKDGMLHSYTEFFDGDKEKAQQLMGFIESKKSTKEVVNLKKYINNPVSSIKIDNI